MSERYQSGMRELRHRMFMMSALYTPSLYSLQMGIWTPSWKMVDEPTPILPGTSPPTSLMYCISRGFPKGLLLLLRDLRKVAKVCRPSDQAVLVVDGQQYNDIVEMTDGSLGGVGVVGNEDITLVDSPAHLFPSTEEF